MSARTVHVLDTAEIAEIELYILRRMRALTSGDHASSAMGSGFDLLGLRDWEPGDAISAIDWAQSSLTNFNPLVTRQFQQDSNAVILALADASLSTRCGARGVLIMSAITRALAAVGLAAAFFQDRFGLIAFDESLQVRSAAWPRIGRSHVLHCLDLYANSFRAPREGGGSAGAIAAAGGYLRDASMIVMISDFLWVDAEGVIDELARIGSVHDVLLMMVDARFAFELPATAAGWLEVCDVETGAVRLISRRELAQLPARIEAWQRRIITLAGEAGLDIVRTGLDRWEIENSLLDLVTQRRLRKVSH